MLAGLDMTPFWGGIKVKDIEPNIGEDSMAHVYKLLEYLYFIKWEDHSESHPPLLTNEKPPLRHFSRSVASFFRSCTSFLSTILRRGGHRRRPRQIYEHQKLHSSVCLHDDSSETPFARLPETWINKSGKRYGWMEVIKLLRDKEEHMKDKAADAFNSSKMFLPPPSFSPTASIASDERKSFRETVRRAGSRSSSVGSFPAIVPQPSSASRQSLKDSASTRGGYTSDKQPGVVQNGLVEAITEKYEPASVPLAVPAEFTLPAGAIELDLLDCDAIPALIVGVLRGTNVHEFLQRLEVLAYTGTYSDYMCWHFFFPHEIFQTLAKRRFYGTTDPSSFR